MSQDSENKWEAVEFDLSDSRKTQEVSPGAPAADFPIRPAHSYPGFWQAVLLLLMFLFLQVLCTLPFIVAGFPLNPTTLAIPCLLSAALAVAYGYKRSRLPFREIFPLRSAGMALLLALLMTVVGLNMVLREVVSFLVHILPPSGNFLKLMEDPLGGRQTLWGSFLFVAVVAPLTEEMIFRGLVLHGFLKRYSCRKAILVSAILFALMHGNPWQFVTATCLGIFLAWCFVKTRSLVPCFFCHCVNNVFGFVPIFLQIKFQISPISGIYANLWYRLGWDVLGIMLAVSGLTMLTRSFSREDLLPGPPPLVSGNPNAPIDV